MRVLAIDYGRQRIGLALSDPTGLLARAWKTVPRVGNAAQVAASLAGEVAALRDQPDGLEAVVLGYPRRLSGETHELSEAVTRLADRLRRAVPVPVVLQDERLTSDEAERRLARAEPDWRKRKAAVDAEAAAIVLQDYLDGRPRRADAAAPARDGERA